MTYDPSTAGFWHARIYQFNLYSVLRAQNALVDARLSYATEQGCTIAMMAASPGSQSQKNAEKKGFRLAYTRTKWKLNPLIINHLLMT